MKTAMIILVSMLAPVPALAQPAAPERQVVEEVEEMVAVLQPAPPLPPLPPDAPESAGWSRSYLGIGVAEIGAERAKALKLTEERGVEITRVDPNSPAEKAGLKQGDVVLEYQGQRVEGTEQFVRLVRETPPGRSVRLLISRGGAAQVITATTGRRELRNWPLGPEFQEQMEKLRDQLGSLRIEMETPRVYMYWRSTRLGVEAETLGAQLAEFFGVKEGVLVRSVLKGTAAEKAGIKAGDVITKVDGQPVRTPAEITRRLRELRAGGAVPVTIVRDRKEMTVTVTVEEERPPAREPARRRRAIVDRAGVRL